MKEMDTVIVPVDFLQNCDKLVDYSIAIAGKMSMLIHFIHVVTFPTGDILIGAPFASEYEGKIITAAQTQMSNLLATNIERCPGCSGEVIIGDPGDKIVETAKTKNGDLIIISTHGAKGLEKMLLGSVAEHVLKLAHCPVLVMNPFKHKWQMLQCVLGL